MSYVMQILPNIILIILLNSYESVQAQISGYQGKRVIMHANTSTYILENGFNGSLELALLRRLSVGMGYTYANCSFKNTPKVLRANIESRHYTISTKFYNNAAYTAPRGNYSYFAHSWGVANAEIARTDTLNSGQLLYTQTDELIVKRYEIGYGVQHIYYSRFCLDTGIGICWANLIGTTNNARELVSKHIQSLYGPNLWNTSALFDMERGFGLSLNVRIGVLLF